MRDHASSCRIAIALLGSLLGITACAKELTPDEVEALVNEQFNASQARMQDSTFQCANGERDWAYICEVRFEPRPGSHDKKAMTWKKVGLIKAGTLKGRPLYNLVHLPDEGPTPSREEEFALRQAEAAEFQKTSERSDAARFR